MIQNGESLLIHCTFDRLTTFNSEDGGVTGDAYTYMCPIKKSGRNEIRDRHFEVDVRNTVPTYLILCKSNFERCLKLVMT